MSNRIVLNEVSYHGTGAINEIVTEVKRRGLNKAFLCSDPELIKLNVTTKVTTKDTALPIYCRIFQGIGY